MISVNQALCCFTVARTSTTTTTVLESKGGESSAPATRMSKRTMMDDVYTTFSSPVAWVLVLALIITWSAVAIIVFDLVDTKSLEGRCSSSFVLHYTGP